MPAARGAPPGPFRPTFWRSPLRGPWLTAVLGLVLLIGLTIVIVTGLLSNVAYQPRLFGNGLGRKLGPLDIYLFSWPTSPSWLYALNQGLHTTIGLALVPVLLAKLWSVIPRLFEWPPVRSLGHMLERLSLALLVGGALFEFVTGIMNIQYWYAFKFDFPQAHYYGAWVFIGAFVAHVCLKFGTMLRSLRTRREVVAVVSGGGAGGVVLAAGAVEAPAAAAPAVAAPAAAAVEPAVEPAVEASAPVVAASAEPEVEAPDRSATSVPPPGWREPAYTRAEAGRGRSREDAVAATDSDGRRDGGPHDDGRRDDVPRDDEALDGRPHDDGALPLTAPDPAPATMSRRALLGTVAAGSVILGVQGAAQSIGGPLRSLAFLLPRGRTLPGPLGFPINKTAVAAGITIPDTGSSWRLTLEGNLTVLYSREQLLGLPQQTYELPIACVEGWSTTQRWTGIRLKDLAVLCGIKGPARVYTSSLDPGTYGRASLGPEQVADDRSLLVLRVNGIDLSLDHGFPARIISPAVPGVHCTKWVTHMKFTGVPA